MITNIDKFRNVAPDMVWRTQALAQIANFEAGIAALSTRLAAVTAEVVGSHRSKSIELPVITVSTPAGTFTLRDNFHDINLMAVLKEPATLSLAQFFEGIQEPLSWDWYLSEISRCRGYSWREWSDEEMSDPRILRIQDKRPGVTAWWETKGDEKDRWMARLSSPEWWTKDWSSGELTWDGNFGPDVQMYCQYLAFAEGIDVATKNRKYTKGVRDFIIAVRSLEAALTIIERLSTKRA